MATISRTCAPRMIRLRSIAGIQETSSPLMTKAPAGLASRPTPPPPAAEASHDSIELVDGLLHVRRGALVIARGERVACVEANRDPWIIVERAEHLGYLFEPSPHASAEARVVFDQQAR